MPKWPATDVTVEIHTMMHDLDARSRLLQDARESFKHYQCLSDDEDERPEDRERLLNRTISNMLEILGMVQRSDESIMQVRRECHMMIEQTSRALQLAHPSPTFIMQSDLTCTCLHSHGEHKDGGQCKHVKGFVQCHCRAFVAR